MEALEEPEKAVGTSGRDEETAETETQERREDEKDRNPGADTEVWIGAETQAQEWALTCRGTQGEVLPLSGLHFPCANSWPRIPFPKEEAVTPGGARTCPGSQPYRALPGSYGPGWGDGGEASSLPPVVASPPTPPLLPAPHLVVLGLRLWLQGRGQGRGLQGKKKGEPGPLAPQQPPTFDLWCWDRPDSKSPSPVPGCEAWGRAQPPLPSVSPLRNGREGPGRRV